MLVLFSSLNVVAQLFLLSATGFPVTPVSTLIGAESATAMSAALTTSISLSASPHSVTGSLATITATTITLVSATESSSSSLTLTPSQYISTLPTANQTSILPSASTQHLNSTAPRYPNVTTSIILTTETLPLSHARPTSTFTSVVTADADPEAASSGNTAVTKGSPVTNDAGEKGAYRERGPTYLSMTLCGVTVWTIGTLF